jgi:hypothetical protein
MRELHNYDELKRAHEGALQETPPPYKEAAPQPEAPPPGQSVPENQSEVQSTRRREQAPAQQPSERERREAHSQVIREENERLVAKQERNQEAERHQRRALEVEKLSREHATMLAGQARDMGDIRDRFDTLGQQPFKKPDEFMPDGNKFAHEKARHEKALSGQGSDIYEAQERAAGAEHAMFMREYKELGKQIEREPDLTKRNQLSMQQDIRAADHLAYTSHRIVDQSVTLTGDTENPTAEDFRVEARKQENESKKVRAEYQRRYGEDYQRSLESADNAREQQTREASSKQQDHTPAGELSEAKQARLAKLNEQFSEAATETTHEMQGPTRPTGRGGAAD